MIANEKVDFWVSHISGDCAIKVLLETIYGKFIKTIGVDEINYSKKNIFLFEWESDFAITPTYKTTTSEFYNLIQILNQNGFYFIADYTTEAETKVNESQRIIFLETLLQIGVSFKKFAVATNNSFSLNLGTLKCGNCWVKTIYFPHFLLATPFYMSQYITDDENHFEVDKIKDFLCLNRRVSTHKYKLLKNLWDRNLLDKTNWTWVDTKLPISDIDTDFISDVNLDFNKTKQLEGDVLYGRELEYRDEYLYTINKNWYYETKINIVSETNVYKKNVIHHTEKTFKPIFLGVPFVVYASKHHIKRLVDLGFKTFGKVIDETYDRYPSTENTINASLSLLEKWDDEQVIDICNYNKSLIKNVEFLKGIVESTFYQSVKTIVGDYSNII